MVLQVLVGQHSFLDFGFQRLEKDQKVLVYSFYFLL